MGDELFFSLAGKHVLEAGCGAGRFTEVLLKAGAYVTSVDLSSAVEANAENFPPGEFHRIAQADILNLPFEPGQFDAVLCLGVIQHTPNPEIAIERLYAQVKPGCSLIIDHYTRAIGRWTSLKWIYRAWLKRQPEDNRWDAIERMTSIFLPLHKRFKQIYPLWFLLCRVSPLTTFYRSLPFLTDELQREFAILDTHDSLTDWHKHLRSKDEIEKTLTLLNAENIVCWTDGNGVEARCRKPCKVQIAPNDGTK
jgi:SAM-dependent methyltransferase